MNYQAQPKSKDTPSRKSRKGGRNASFIHNRTLRRRINREKRAEKALNKA